MKRLIGAALIVIMLLPSFAATAFASGHGYGQNGGQVCVGNQVCRDKTDCVTVGNCTNDCRYADENGDNICDHCENRCSDCGEIRDENADGICDQCGKCSHYADENDDGVCDHQANCENRKNTTCRKVHKNSGPHGRRHRNHH